VVLTGFLTIYQFNYFKKGSAGWHSSNEGAGGASHCNRIFYGFLLFLPASINVKWEPRKSKGRTS
jgi:hypothetical protein